MAWPKGVPAPPYKVTDNGNVVTVGGRKYNLDNDQNAVSKLPDTVITRMARYMVDTVDKLKGGSGYTGPAKDWLAGKRATLSDGTTAKVLNAAQYGVAVSLIQTGEIDTPPILGPGGTGIIPGNNDPLGIVPKVNSTIGTFSSIADAVTSLISALFSAEFWIRALEVLSGLVLLGVGATHLTTASNPVGSTLSKVPVYGKLIK